MNKEEILNLIDTKVEKFHVDAWSRDIWVRTYSAADRSRLIDRHNSEESIANHHEDYLAALAAYSICDADGKRLFSDADIPALSQKSGAALEQIGSHVTTMNSLGTTAIDDAKKNSKKMPTSSSSST
jgi:hypothetical protein